MSKIFFTSVLSNGDILEYPEPASKNIPDWYKDTDSYIGGNKKPQKDGTPSTIKKCMPVFDAIISGYIIKSPADVWVQLTEDGNQEFIWSNHNLISFHPISQAPLHPNLKPHAYPKWNNPWAIKTPKGYSTLFVQPFHRDAIFTILPGIVDTDKYSAPVNFPFVINDPNFEGMIPKGTPIAQVIPFKRESWNMEIGSNKEFKEQETVTAKLFGTFFDRYKTLFWTKKEYR